MAHRRVSNTFEHTSTKLRCLHCTNNCTGKQEDERINRNYIYTPTSNWAAQIFVISIFIKQIQSCIKTKWWPITSDHFEEKTRRIACTYRSLKYSRHTLLKLSVLLHKTSCVEHFKCFYCNQGRSHNGSHKGLVRVAEGPFRRPEQRPSLDQYTTLLGQYAAAGSFWGRREWWEVGATREGGVWKAVSVVLLYIHRFEQKSNIVQNDYTKKT